jgi:hypothetical protein
MISLRMRIYSLLLAAGLVFSGCSFSTTDLSYRNGILALQLDRSRLTLPARELSRQIDNFSTLAVTHYLLALEGGGMAVFDKARTDMRYEFQYPTAETIRIVFDAKAVHRVYFENSFYVFQVVLADGSLLNVIAEQLEDESLNMLYGMSNAVLARLLDKLHGGLSGSLYAPVRTVTGKSGAIYSKWTIQKVNVMQLVGPKRDIMGF